MKVIVLLNEELILLDGYMQYPIDLSDYEEGEDYLDRRFKSEAEAEAYLRGMEDFALVNFSIISGKQNDVARKVVGLPK